MDHDIEFQKRLRRGQPSSPTSVDSSDINELIRISNRLRHRSDAAQRAAARASLLLRDVVKRSIDVCGK